MVLMHDVPTPGDPSHIIPANFFQNETNVGALHTYKSNKMAKDFWQSDLDL